MYNAQENIKDKNIQNNLNLKGDDLLNSNNINRRYENNNKQSEEEAIKNINYSSPKNYNQPNIHNNKNSTNNNELAFKESKLEKFQHVAKLTRKKIAPIDGNGKNVYMNKTNKSNDFMKYINKTLYPDKDKKQSEDNYNNNNNNNTNNNEKVSTIKSMTDLKNHLELLQMNSPSNMKKTLNTLTMKNSHKNGNNISHLNNFNNIFSQNNPATHTNFNHMHTQSLNENTFKNIINGNNNNPFGYPFPTVSTNNNINNYHNANHQNQTTKFLFDVSNFQKFNKTDNAKYATKPAGIISSFGVNTNFGNVRYFILF